MSNYNNQESFLEGLKVDSNKQRLIALKRNLDDGEIEIESLSKEDIRELIELYDEETDNIKAETNKTKERIKRELQKLKRK